MTPRSRRERVHDLLEGQVEDNISKGGAAERMNKGSSVDCLESDGCGPILRYSAENLEAAPPLDVHWRALQGLLGLVATFPWPPAIWPATALERRLC